MPTPTVPLAESPGMPGAADPCMQGHPCQICKSFTADQRDKIVNRRKYTKKKDRSSLHRPDLSGELESAQESEVKISAEREQTLLDLSTEAVTQPELAQEAMSQDFQGRDPPTCKASL